MQKLKIALRVTVIVKIPNIFKDKHEETKRRILNRESSSNSWKGQQNMEMQKDIETSDTKTSDIISARKMPIEESKSNWININANDISNLFWQEDQDQLIHRSNESFGDDCTSFDEKAESEIPIPSSKTPTPQSEVSVPLSESSMNSSNIVQNHEDEENKYDLNDFHPNMFRFLCEEHSQRSVENF